MQPTGPPGAIFCLLSEPGHRPSPTAYCTPCRVTSLCRARLLPPCARTPCCPGLRCPHLLASPHTAPAPCAPGDGPGDHLRGQRHAARTCDEARAKRILLNCLPRPVRCCFHRPGPIRHVPSRLRPLMTALSSPVRSSVCSFSAAPGCRGRWRHASAVATGAWTHSETTAPPAPQRACSPLERCHLSGQLPGSAARPERGSRGMSVWLT